MLLKISNQGRAEENHPEDTFNQEEKVYEIQKFIIG
jgi:hypothetical protein